MNTIDATTLLNGAVEVLRQGETLLRALDDETYIRKLPVAYDASIGAHYRHCLDHFRSVFDALDAAEVNYDKRARDPWIETDRDCALTEIRKLLLACELFLEELVHQPVSVRSKVSYAGHQSPAAQSTVGREVMYAIAHAIHHYALIGIMCALLGVSVPAGFGVAPSTLKHQAAMQTVKLAA